MRGTVLTHDGLRPHDGPERMRSAGMIQRRGHVIDEAEDALGGGAKARSKGNARGRGQETLVREPGAREV